MAPIDSSTDVVVGWSAIWMTGIVVGVQFVLCYAFFMIKRSNDERNKVFDLYETRQHSLGHRSPPPFQPHWYLKAYQMSDSETLRCVGLDSYMFLRLLRFGARLTALGTGLSIILIPIYSTGTARGNSTEGFNKLTLARVEHGDKRMAITVVAWYIFIGFILRELHNEWKSFALLRQQYLARGDEDVPKEFRYSILCEQVPEWLQSEKRLKKYFDRLFPEKVAQTTICMEMSCLDKLVEEREKVLNNLERADACAHHPKVSIGGRCSCCWGEKVDAIEHYRTELSRLNTSICHERELVPLAANHVRHQRKLSRIFSSNGALNVPENLFSGRKHSSEANNFKQPTDLSSLIECNESHFSFSDDDEEQDIGEHINQIEINESKISPSSTAFVTFTSLRAKQAAAQCALTPDRTSMRVFHAPDPRSVLWENINFPLSMQDTAKFGMKVVWIVGILFWAIPVSVVNSLANLNSILQALNIKTVDSSKPWYGFLSGLLPVIALALLLDALYALIVLTAKRVLKLKSLSDVDAYATYWYQLYQFANLWLIVIGGSIFNQFQSFLNDPQSIVTTIANAMIGSSVFFVNMTLTQSIGKCALDISQLQKFVIALLMRLWRSESTITQRQMDRAKIPETYQWGYEIPQILFILMIVVLYCPIVPIMEVFGLIYFAGRYITYKHQFLHVNAQTFEGGGNATWLSIFVFIISIIYMAEAVFIAYMGLKQSPASAAFAFVPLVVTFVFHLDLRYKTITYLQNLPLQRAAAIDVKEGECSDFNRLIYLQPSLNTCLDEQFHVVDSNTRGPDAVF
eukprot:CAMPEP_0171330718 /NCGR_PEP_ID=MMETSP0878-20121228/2205_1 /TAXON_ID=67004 /ORGANISM="Thalassiosira weissflogii, Strain CCMP1336" /LENGTH=799 /DNA_ID=CAMNT_0011831089 /DNA_START=263 /DNA_END=2662 /DNA_ORIENTATION=+